MKTCFHALWTLFLLAGCAGAPSPRESVQVFCGTDFAGHTYPGATLPYGAVQLSPDTDTNTCSGYHYSHGRILGFSHTHLSGTGCPDYGDFLITPGRDSVQALPFSHADENASPGYYRVHFPAQGITAELTATLHTGVHRYHFTGPGPRRLRLDASHCIGWWSSARQVKASYADGELTASRRVDAWAKDRPVFLSGSFSTPPADVEETALGTLVFTFPDTLQTLTLRAGISAESLEGARANRLSEAEGHSFDALREQAFRIWDGALGRIRVKGGPQQLFYTNLYRCYLTPNRIEDVTAPAPRYSTFSVWDTFRAWHPLQTLLDPPFVSEMIQSMLAHYRRHGELPIWPVGEDETGCMIGYHSVSVIADAWLQGIRGFDGEEALEAMVASSRRNKAQTAALYDAFGYVPADLKAESVSQTLEFAYDDWCIARMAESLGREELAAAYYARSLRYRYLFDPSSGFFTGRLSDGTRLPLPDPLKGAREYTEATPWHYRFFVPHDIAGLEELMGGREAFSAALDSLFTYAPAGQTTIDGGIGGWLGQYAHGNEPGHHLPYLFHFTGAPYRTQEIVREILTRFYSTAPDGICGNEDCGQMSAWYVLSSLGLYPLCPGSGQYHLVAPLFREATVQLGSGKELTIRADHPDYPYIAGVSLNGQPVTEHYLTYAQIVAGGTLSFRLSATPVHARDTLAAPYSLSLEKPSLQPSVGETVPQKGCWYTYHEAFFTRLDQIEGDPPEAFGTMSFPNVSHAPAKDHFAYAFSGFVELPESGEWTFQLESDCGAGLFVDAKAVESGKPVHLEKGRHSYRLLYFEDGGKGAFLRWRWKAPGAARFADVPPGALSVLTQ